MQTLNKAQYLAKCTPRAGVTRRTVVHVHANNELSGFAKFAKKVQGALPIVGLLSRLTSPAGGFDDQSYNEFSRALLDKCTTDFQVAANALEKKYGKQANIRQINLLLWMAKLGVGLIPTKDILNASRRIRVSLDMEIEVDRFEATREEVMKKYTVMDPPEGKLSDKLAVAIDSVCILVLGIKDGELPQEEDAKHMVSILKDAFPEASVAQLQEAISSRPARVKA